MKIGIITFHAAHNYGSMLQNYALQKIIREINPDCEVFTINLRNLRQDDMYNVFKPFSEYRDKRRYIINILLRPWRKQLKEKYLKFEDFLERNIVLTEEVNEGTELQNLPKMDCYIAGSDQIWNIGAKDFDWSYYLDFVKETPEWQPKRISYAPSMGPNPYFPEIKDQEREALKQLIRKFNAITVREEKTANEIQRLGELEVKPEVLPDPTLLLSKDQWEALAKKPEGISDKTDKYIFLYNPYYLSSVYHQAKALSKITGLKVVVSNLPYNALYDSRGFTKVLECGPSEFLWLVKNAEYVIGRSFHVAVFAMIFQKKFIAVNGMSDSRLGNFLSSINMEICATGKDDVKTVREKVDKIQPSDWARTEMEMNRLRNKGIDFLKRNLAQ